MWTGMSNGSFWAGYRLTHFGPSIFREAVIQRWVDSAIWYLMAAKKHKGR